MQQVQQAPQLPRSLGRLALASTQPCLRILPPSPPQVHVQQVPHASDGSGVGWFLDRVEVSGPEGEHWSFPCSAWLGKEASHTGLDWGECPPCA